jgi:hypothetical protein
MLEHRSGIALIGALLFAAFGTPSSTEAQRNERTVQASPDVPPVSMTCPMHPDVVESQPGTCPLCKMNLVPVRLETIWTCPVHSIVSEREPGVCRICRRDLIQMTVAVTWTCAERADINQIDRGTCPDGTPMIVRRTLRPHGNHNPQHGGQFFMAPDTFHHLEGAYPRANVFRLYLYDDYARPLPKDQARRVKARVVTKERFDPATRATTEIAAFPLALAPGGTYLEARVDGATLPAQMTAKVRFKDDAPEYRFDFTFPALTKETRAATLPKSTASRSSGTAARPGPAPPPPSADARAVSGNAPAKESASTAIAEADPGLPRVAIPETVEEILAQIETRKQEIGELVDRGSFGAVWVPAFQAKDLSVALEAKLDALAPDKRDIAAPAIMRLVRSAWLLDAVGDIGNRQQVVDAYSAFAAAVGDVTSAFKR